MDINSNIKNIEFKCIYNASGPRCTTSEDLNKLDKSYSGAILTKSCTLELREGNKKPRYFENVYGSINSMGLPNFGVDFYIKESINRSKPYFISICGLSKNENFGNVYLEALCAGTPIITSKFTPFNDIEKFSSGHVLSMNEKKIIIFLEKLDKIHKKKIKVSKKYISNFNRKKIVSKFEDFYQKVYSII